MEYFKKFLKSWNQVFYWKRCTIWNLKICKSGWHLITYFPMVVEVSSLPKDTSIIYSMLLFLTALIFDGNQKV